MMTRDLRRSIEFRLAELQGDGDGLTLSGYAAVFDQATRIDSWEGTFTESLRRGAFRKTLRERTPVLQFEHGRHPLVGSLPIGRVETLREDEQGLYVEARLTDNWLTQPVRDAIANESIDGMSFRFEVVREEWHDAQGKRLTDPAEIQRLLWEPGERGPLARTLVEVRLFELGPVVFPAYEGTSVGVRMAEAVAAADVEKLRAMRASLAAEAPVAAGYTEQEVRSLLDPQEFVVPLNMITTRTNSTFAAGGLITGSSTITLPAREASTTSDAPPAEEHPAEPAAPLQEHPSPSTHEQRAAYMRRAYLTRSQR